MSQYILKKLAKLIFLSGLLLGSAWADDAYLELEKYINNFQTVAIEFTQQDSNNNISRGMLIIDKPHKFRCNYYAPFPLVIIGNKNYISVYDFQMKSFSRIKSSENSFNFLLNNNAQNLQKSFRIIATSVNQEDYIVRFRNLINKNIGEITFDVKSKDIKKMIMYEDNNQITLYFDKIFRLEQVPVKLFQIKDPDLFGKPQRLEQHQLYKILGLSPTS